MSSSVPRRLGMALKNQMWTTGAASSMWPMRLRRTRLCVTLTPQRSQIMPLYFMPAVLAAGAFPVLLGPEDALAEQAVLFRPVGAVVDRLRLLHLAERPAPDVVRAGEPDPDGAVVVDTIVGTFTHAHETLSSAGHSAVPKRGGWWVKATVELVQDLPERPPEMLVPFTSRNPIGTVRRPAPTRIQPRNKKSPRALPPVPTGGAAAVDRVTLRPRGANRIPP